MLDPLRDDDLLPDGVSVAVPLRERVWVGSDGVKLVVKVALTRPDWLIDRVLDPESENVDVATGVVVRLSVTLDDLDVLLVRLPVWDLGLADKEAGVGVEMVAVMDGVRGVRVRVGVLVGALGEGLSEAVTVGERVTRQDRVGVAVVDNVFEKLPTTDFVPVRVARLHEGVLVTEGVRDAV